MNKLLEELDASLTNIKSSNTKEQASALTIGYILQLQDRIVTEKVTIVNDKGTDITKPFLLKLEDMMKESLDRSLVYEFIEAPINFYDEDEEYRNCPRAIRPNDTPFLIQRVSDKVEVGRCLISNLDERTVEVVFVELKPRFINLPVNEVMTDCVYGEFGPLQLRFNPDFNGLPRQR